MGCQSLTEIDMNKEYKYFSTKMKIRAYKKQGKKIYTKWNILTKLEVLWLISKFSYFIMITDQKDITSPVLTFKIFILKI